MLLMDGVAIAFAHLIAMMNKAPPSEVALVVVCTSAVRVVREMAQLAEDGFHSHDWHVGNIAFEDNDYAWMFLVDWEKCDSAGYDPIS